MDEYARDTEAGVTDTLFGLAREGLGPAPSGLGRTRLRTFIALRWLGVAGQTLTVLVVHLWMGVSLRLDLCLAVIALSAWLNVYLSFANPPQKLATPNEVGWQLVFDTLQLAGLLFATGGLANPFAFLIIAPATVAALTVGGWRAVTIAALAIGLSVGMLATPFPLHWADGAAALPNLYQVGHLVALAVGIVFFSFSAWRVGKDEERLVRALDAAQVVVSREQRLSAIGAMAAMTAHELGTPLATIHLVAKELEREVSEDDPFHEDVRLLAEQAERCRKILSKLSRTQDAEDAVLARMPIRAVVDEAAAPYRGSPVEIAVRHQAVIPGAWAAPELKRSPEVLHALGAFIENAVSFARTRVEVEANWSPQNVIVTIKDDGPGFDSDILPKLGEPYVTKPSPDRRGGGDNGLGFFIAKTLIEQTGGRLATRNRAAPRTGAVVQAVWPRSALEAEPLHPPLKGAAPSGQLAPVARPPLDGTPEPAR